MGEWRPILIVYSSTPMVRRHTVFNQIKTTESEHEQRPTRETHSPRSAMRRATACRKRQSGVANNGTRAQALVPEYEYLVSSNPWPMARRPTVFNQVTTARNEHERKPNCETCSPRSAMLRAAPERKRQIDGASNNEMLRSADIVCRCPPSRKSSSNNSLLLLVLKQIVLCGVLCAV